MIRVALEKIMRSGRHIFIATAAASLFLLVQAGVCRGAGPHRDQVAEIVASVLKAYGGAEAVGKVISVTAKGRIAEYLNGNAGNYARYLERPRKLRIEVMPEQGGEVRILDGDRGWQVGNEGFVKVSPLELQAMIYQYSYLDLPMAFVGGSLTARYGGREQYREREAYLLLIELKNAPVLHILIDAKTHLIVKVSANFAMGMMGASELSTEYHDFRPIDGVLFPHRLVNFAGGTKLSEITIDEIAINRKLPGELFAPR